MGPPPPAGPAPLGRRHQTPMKAPFSGHAAVEDLAVTARDVAYAVIKASDVMVATE